MHVKKIRAARKEDLGQVIEIDALITGLRKPAYWAAVMQRYGGRFFLVFHEKDLIQGYVVGEIRDWEFGAPPCGWVFGIGVRPQARLAGIAAKYHASPHHLAKVLRKLGRAGLLHAARGGK